MNLVGFLAHQAHKDILSLLLSEHSFSIRRAPDNIAVSQDSHRLLPFFTLPQRKDLLSARHGRSVATLADRAPAKDGEAAAANEREAEEKARAAGADGSSQRC